MLEELMTRLGDRPGVEISEQTSCWNAHVVAPGGWEFEVVVPRGVFEWSVDAWGPDSPTVTWSSSSAWRFRPEFPDRDLHVLFMRDVERFVDLVLDAEDLRIRTESPRDPFGEPLLQSKCLEARNGSGWEMIEIGEFSLPQMG